MEQTTPDENTSDTPPSPQVMEVVSSDEPVMVAQPQTPQTQSEPASAPEPQEPSSPPSPGYDWSNLFATSTLPISQGPAPLNFTLPIQQQQSAPLMPAVKPSYAPWIIGGVAAFGLLALVAIARRNRE